MRLSCCGSGSDGNCYILESDNEILLLDAGNSVKNVLININWNISKISGVLITHSHSDHYKYAREWEKRGIPVIAPFDSDKKLQTLKRGSCFSFKLIPLQDSQGRWVHSNSDGTECPNYGYYIQHPDMGSLIYATDCEFIKWKFKKVDHYLIEANYDLDELNLDDDENKKSYVNRVFASHHSIQAACKFIEANKDDCLKNVILCHLSQDNGNPEKFKSMMQEVVGNNVNVEIAKKGLEIEL